MRTRIGSTTGPPGDGPSGGAEKKPIRPPLLLPSASRSGQIEITIEDVLQHLLPARDVGGRVALFEHVAFQILEAGLALLDLLADARIPGGVALLDEVLEDSLGANLRRDLEAAGKGVHAADV